MRVSLPYDKGLGNAAIYSRVRNGAQFWDFTAKSWVNAETVACRSYLLEVPYASPTTSWYQGAFTDPPGGQFPVELVLLSTGDVIGNDLVQPVSTSAPMSALTGAGILDDAMSILQTGGGSAVRVKMLRWLNVIASMLATERPWCFLSNGVATITPINNAIPLPADFGDFKYIQAASVFYFDARNRLTPGEAAAMDSGFAGSASPRGFTMDNAFIYLHGAGYTLPVTLGYTIAPAGIADDATPTCWPWQCRVFLMKACLDFFYEFDMDERRAASYQIEGAELSRLKKWDNAQKPKTQHNAHGYRRTR